MEFGYDSLGRRISRYDPTSQLMTYYVYDNDWRVIAEYEREYAENDFENERWFVFGNGVDEVLAMFTPEKSYDANDVDDFMDFVECWLCSSASGSWAGCSVFDANDTDSINYGDWAYYIDEWNLPSMQETRWYYLHDALGSVRGLVGGRFDRDGEREFYNYDVYGEIEHNDMLSEVGNPYYFTARRVDQIDGPYLMLQYNRNRYYNYDLDRWITMDPLGVVPNAQKPNRFSPVTQYRDGINLYEYAKSNPVNYWDGYGLARDCDIWQYKQESKYRHKGIIMGDVDYDYGPSSPEIFGTCKWPDNGHTAGNKKDNAKKLKIKTVGYLLVYDEKYKPCKCATCNDIQECLQEVCNSWDGGLYNITKNCWTFVGKAKGRCCLK